jgi:hypothetical protein
MLPERFVEGHKYSYVLDALGQVPGFQRAYHLGIGSQGPTASVV